MKKYLCILFGAAMLVSCSKESELSVNDKIIDGKYTVTAHIGELTKATISTDGHFAWSGVGKDQIAIWDSAHKEFVTFTLSEITDPEKKEGKFSASIAEDGAVFEGSVAYYPASIATKSGETPTYTFPTSFSSLDDAAKSFPMQGTVSSGEIHFNHLGALINITLNNVPSFTTALILNDGTKDITVTAAPTAGVINAVVPIPAGEYVLTAKLKDNNNNIFYSKARTSKTYSARNYYTINPITLGYLLTFTNEAGWDSPKVHIWQTSNNSINTDITTGGTYPHKLFLRSTNIYYVLLDSSVETWTAYGNAIGVQFFSNETDKTQTDCVYLYRNIDFVIPGGGGMRTMYRTYMNKRSDNAKNNWGAVAKVYVKTEGTYTGEFQMIALTSDLFYYENLVDDYGKSMSYRFHNTNNWYPTGKGSEDYWTYYLNREYIYDVD